MLFDYFAAPSDSAAAEAIEAGPADRFPTASLPAVDPTVALAKLEELLTGVGYDSVVDGSRAGQALAVRNDGEQVVITVTDELQAALGAANEARLRGVTGPWSEIEEFSWAPPEPADLVVALVALAGLAKAASGRGERLYCWICV